MASRASRAISLVQKGRILMFESVSADGGFDASKVLSKEATPEILEALELFNQAIDLWPECRDALIERSKAYRSLGENDRAKLDARRAMSLGFNAEECIFIAQAFEGEEARSILREGIAQVSPEDPAGLWLRRQLALNYWYEGDFESQGRELEVLLLQHGDTSVCSMLGLAYEGLGRLQDAERTYKRDLPRCAYHLIEVKILQGALGEASRHLSRMKQTLCQHEALVFSAILDALANRPVDDLPKALRVIENQADGPLGVDHFSAGILHIAGGNRVAGCYHLRLFINDASTSTDGIRLSWKLKKARELLASFQSDEAV